MNDLLKEALQAADDPKYKDRFPGVFIEMMGLRGASMQFLQAGWELFKLERRPISPAEISHYIEEKSNESKKRVL